MVAFLQNSIKLLLCKYFMSWFVICKKVWLLISWLYFELYKKIKTLKWSENNLPVTKKRKKKEKKKQKKTGSVKKVCSKQS